MTIPRFDESLSSSWTEVPEDIDQIQHWIDHPSLDSTVHGQVIPGRSRLHDDELRCIELLNRGPRINEAGSAETALRFESPALIGAGSFGLVFRAWDRLLKRDVAIKFLRPSVQVTQHIQARFALEAEALARCDVEGIIPVYDSGVLEGNPYMVTGYIRGPSLAEYCRKHTLPLPVNAAAHLVREIAIAVHEAHVRGILHRDLKPSNILLEPRADDARGDERRKDALAFRAYVSDFGLAKDNAERSQGACEDRSGETPIVGTIRYMSPEQASGIRSEVSIESDIYSLGIILFELVTGRFPRFVRGSNDGQVASRLKESSRKINPAAPIELDAVIAKAIAERRVDRYASAAEFADDLKRFLDGRPTLARAPGYARTAWLWVRRNPTWACLWATLWTATIVTSLFVYSLYCQNAVLLKLERDARMRSEKNEAMWLSSIKSIYRFMTENALRDKPQSEAKEMELHLAALDHCEKYAAQEGYSQQSTHLLSIANHYVASAYQRRSMPAVALPYRKRCLELVDGLIAKFPTNPDYHFDRFMSLLLLCDLELDATLPERAAIAEKSQRSLEHAIALTLSDSPNSSDPHNIDYQDALAAILYKRAELADNPKLATEMMTRSISISESLFKSCPERPFLSKYAIQGHTWLAERAIASGDNELVLREVQQSIAFFDCAFAGCKPILDTLLLETRPRELLAAVADKLQLAETEEYYHNAIRVRHGLEIAYGSPVEVSLGEMQLMVQLCAYLQRIGKHEAFLQNSLHAREFLADYVPVDGEEDVYRGLLDQINGIK